MSDNYFVELAGIDVGEHIEKKNNLSYLSWAWAWRDLKTRHPDAAYTIYENKDGWFYHTDGKTCWVKTGVTVNGIEHIEYLPVMDFRNKSIPADKVTSFDVNKAIQRSLTKAVARHGLGLYIYAGEDLPESEDLEQPPKPVPAHKKLICADCGQEITGRWHKDAAYIAAYSEKKFGVPLCGDCSLKRKAAEEAAQAPKEDNDGQAD